MKPKENLLNLEEINQILLVANSDFSLRHPNLVSTFGNNKTDILKVTPKSGVIIINGNNDTGFTHVNIRHNFWSGENFWKSGDDGYKLENPSQFSRKSMPIVDYPNISDQLFSEKNLNNSGNTRPEIFDIYIGEVVDEINGNQSYKLITYKNTPILHTLFPMKRENNLIKKTHKTLPYKKGKMKVSVTFYPTEVIVAIPYNDVNGKPIYAFEMHKFIEENKEVGIVRDLELSKCIGSYERKILEGYKYDIESLDQETFGIYHFGLSNVEKHIKNYDDYKKRNTKSDNK